MANESQKQWKKDAKIRFRDAFEEYMKQTNKKIPAIARELDISESTIKDTLSYSKDNLNADLVIAFCLKYKPVDINYIYTGVLQEPAGQPLEKSNFTMFRHSHDCHELLDDAYMGTFYGYCRNTQYNHILDDFVLTIYKTPYETVQATMVLNSHSQQMHVMKKTLYGKPMLLEPNIIYMVMQSDYGDDMFILSFNWFKIRSGSKLYCRYGGLITPYRATDRYPQLQSFVLLDQPVLEDHLHYIDGFLRLSQDKIIVPDTAYEAESGGLLATDPAVQEFFSRCKDLTYTKESYYCFSEKVLLALGEANEIDFDTTAAAIIKLKEHSMNPKSISYPNNKTYSKFLTGLCTEKTAGE